VTSRRAPALVAVWTVPSLVFLVFTWINYAAWRIEVPPRLDDGARAAVMASLRDALDRGLVAAPVHPALARRLPRGGPVAVTVYVDGQPLGRVDGYGQTIALATRAAAAQLVTHRAAKLTEPWRARARIKVDVVVGRGPIDREQWPLTLVALHPGLEGLAVTLPDPPAGVAGELMLLPDDMFLRGLLARKPISRDIPDVGMGVELEKADRILHESVGLGPKAWAALDRRYARVRTDAFVERPGHDGPPLPLTRGLPPGPPVTADVLEAAALEGARYLVAHLGPNGRYVYEQNLTTGAATDPLKGGAYSLPRHAGTTYFLAEAYRLTQASWLREPIERAFAHLDDLLEASTCQGTLPDGARFACVADRGERRPVLGSTALAVVALAEYQRATGDRRYLDMATRLSAFILMMQRPDGSFRHVYELKTRTPSEKEKLLYFSGEAALAMARMYAVTGDERYAVSAEKALDWLVDWYDFFVGGFIYGEEHWTCIASEALWPRVAKPKWLAFCNGLARFWGSAQPWPGDHPDQGDLAGAHMVTPFLMPHNTPAGSHSEASISTYLLGRHLGRPEPWLRTQILATLHYLLRQQIRADNDFAVVAGARGLGGVPGSPVDRMVRIDYVQHVCSAMLRGVELAREVPRSPAYP
jgi:hypothetical protein